METDKQDDGTAGKRYAGCRLEISRHSLLDLAGLEGMEADSSRREGVREAGSALTHKEAAREGTCTWENLRLRCCLPNY